MKIWDLHTEQCALSIEKHFGVIWDVSFDQTGNFLATASEDGTCRIHDVETGQSPQNFRDHVDSVNSVHWQPYFFLKKFFD